MYSEEMIAPMRGELTEVGCKELKTPQEVERVMKNMKGTALVAINSVCGCAAGMARPGVVDALQGAGKKPTEWYTSFAGVDREAVEKIREYAAPHPPSSPCVMLFKEGTVVGMIAREDVIGGRSSDAVRDKLRALFEQHC